MFVDAFFGTVINFGPPDYRVPNLVPLVSFCVDVPWLGLGMFIFPGLFALIDLFREVACIPERFVRDTADVLPFSYMVFGACSTYLSAVAKLERRLWFSKKGGPADTQ